MALSIEFYFDFPSPYSYLADTHAAAERGVFGSPTMFVGDQMFFGNDRLDILTEALRAAQ